MHDRDLVRKDQQSSPASSPRGTNYLLAIAINDYLHCSKLNNAVGDVEAFIELMTTRYNFEAKHVTFIKDTDATKKHIEQTFLRLIKTITPQDNLIVYFSGHGRHDEHFGGNWVPVDAGTTDDDWPDYLSNDQVKSYLSKIKSFHTFLIADSCFSGSLFIDKSKEKFSGDRRDTEPSRWGLTSGKKEIVSDGQPGHHSPFAAALLDVLRKADQPIGVMRVCDLVLEKVAANADQTPMGSPLQVPGHQGGQMVLYFREQDQHLDSFLSAPNDEDQSTIKQPDTKYANTLDYMSLVIGGEFEMGDVMGDNEFSNETIHKVILNDFLLAKFPITFKEYDEFYRSLGTKLLANDNRPVFRVNWAGAVFYCNWRSELEGLKTVYSVHNKNIMIDPDAEGYRLPTEAEWEYAAREGGKKIRFGNGKNIADPLEVNFCAKKKYVKPYSLPGKYRGVVLPVGMLNCPNALGLYDMSGNVWEWCWDRYSSYPKETQTNPLGPDKGSYRVIRGGAWDCTPSLIRVAHRGALPPDVASLNIGFRVARNA